ncbi:C39 family peptidase [Rhodococcus sp. NPDC054953]
MDDLDPAADIWSGSEHTTVIDDSASATDDLLPTDTDIPTTPEAEPTPSAPSTPTEGETAGTVLADDIPDLTDPQIQDGEPASMDPATDGDDGIHGNPVAWTLNWFYQQVDGYCGPSAVAQIVSQYTGATITDPQQLVDRATELGLMGDPGDGMSLPNIEALLEDQGVPATITDSSLDDLRARLDGGYGVIAMVDSGEIWQPDQESGEDDTADHVLVVAGIDDTRGVVILSDPGVPSGNQLEVPIEQFEQAWADSGHQMLVTDAPDSGLLDQPTAVPADRSAIIRLSSSRR